MRASAESPKAAARRKAKERAVRLQQQAVDQHATGTPACPVKKTKSCRVSHVLIKHEGSARPESWRDPDGKRIQQRTQNAAGSILSKMLEGLRELDGHDRGELMAQLASEVSDCGSARDGGGGDLGELEAGDMDEAFEETVFDLPVWGLSGVIETDSGSHIVLRTPTDYSVAADAEEPVRASHILVKYDGSARPCSWRDPEGTEIRERSRADAVAVLDSLRDELLQVSGRQRLDRFAELAREVSDCGSAREEVSGDLGELVLSEMADEIAAAFASGLEVGELSEIVETESGLHIVLRTEAERDGRRLRLFHILVKHQGSARPSSWRDPGGEQIRERTRDVAESQLRGILGEVHALKGTARAEGFASLAGKVSDCGSARDGGGGDLGELEAGDMDEAFEETVFDLPVWGLSGVIETDSGSHIVLRTPTDYSVAADAEEPVRASHILVKYDGSARPCSWRDPEGTEIRERSRADAVAVLDSLRDELLQVSGRQRLDRFAELAREVSDCGSAREEVSGDLGELVLSEMADEIAAAFASGLEVGELSEIVETESGLHIVLRTEAERDGRRLRLFHILVKHQGSARPSSWRDPGGEQIRERTRDVAESQLRGILGEVHALKGTARAEGFASLAGKVSDCGSARDGGGGDLGELEAGDMDEAFEETVFDLPVWGLSGVIETDSGSHIVLRTPTDYSVAADAEEPVRASHILVKYDGSARPCSWRDPEGTEIRERSRADAVAVLDSLRDELLQVSGRQRLDRFAELAREVSDCGSAREEVSGDLGELVLSEMADEIAAAFASGLEVGELSEIVETESGLHIVLRTEAERDGRRLRLFHILVKHQGSARPSSWRDPGGEQIRERTRDVAESQLRGILGEMHALKGTARAEGFASLAGKVSDCGSARDGGGGDLGELEAGDMDEAFEETVFDLPVWGLSGVIETDSGSHIVLRTPTDYALPAQLLHSTAIPQAAEDIQSTLLVELRSELHNMKFGQVKSRARYAGVTSECLDTAIDSAVDDPKASIIELIVKNLSEMRDGLTVLRMGQIKAKAVEQAGLSLDVVNAMIAESVDNPKEKLIELIMQRAMHPPELDPAAIEHKRQAMALAAAEAEASREAAEEAERAHKAARQAATVAAEVAKKEEQEAIDAAAAAAREEAEAVAAEAAASIEQQEAEEAEAMAAKEQQDVVEAERILAEAKTAGADAEQIAKAEASLAREKQEAEQAKQVAERERAEADEAARAAERERSEADTAKGIAAKELEEATQAKAAAESSRVQEAEAKAQVEEETALARNKAMLLDEATQAATVDVDGIASGNPSVIICPSRPTADEMHERFGWRSLHDAIADSAPWDQLRQMLEADPTACGEVRASGSGDDAEGMLPLHALLSTQPRFAPVVGMRLRAKKRPLGHRNMSGDKYYPCDVLAVSDDGRTMTVSYPDEGKRGIQDDALPVELVEPESAPKAGGAANLPVDLVEKMISAYPAGCQIKDSTGFLPVQYAMKNGASVDIVRALRFTGSPTVVYKPYQEKVTRAMGKIRTLRKTKLLTPSLSNLGKAMQMETEEATKPIATATDAVAAQEATPSTDPNGVVASGRQLSAAEKVARASALSLPTVVDEAPE